MSGQKNKKVKKVVLAYSGGLDTTVLVWDIREAAAGALKKIQQPATQPEGTTISPTNK